MGRAELRLYKLKDKDAYSSTRGQPQWIELKEKQHCYANLGSLELGDRELRKHIVGSLCLLIKYTIVADKKLTSPNPDVASISDKGPQLVSRQRSLSLPTILPSMESTLDLSEADDDGFDSKSLLDFSPQEIGGEAPANIIAETVGEEVQTELSSSREINYFAKKISGWVLTEEDYQVVQNLLNGLAGFGQGIVVSRVSLTIAYLIVQRYHRALPREYSNNIALTKEDIELPRIIYKYAYAAHGWPALYFFGKRSEVFSDVVSSDVNYKAVLQFLQLDSNDMLVCVLDEHRLFRPNFYVALDRRLSAVILSVRGTMSVRDTLTDLSFEYIQWRGGVVHSGIMMSAKWFLDNVGKQLCMFAAEYGMSQIILTGHSLGGATAALAAIMLTDELEENGGWPVSGEGKRVRIHCYTYGTPPILSPDLARKYEHLIDTFIFGDDIIPRLSYGTMLDLQILMVYAAEIGRASDMFGTMEGSILQRRLDECRAAIQAGDKIENAKLYVPGRVHHIMTIKAPNNRKYTVIDTCGPNRFCDILLKRGMLSHHMPNHYERGFEDAYVTYLLHELEERQTRQALSIRDKLTSVVSLLSDVDSFAAGSGLFFPRASSSPSLRAQSSDSAFSIDSVADSDGTSTILDSVHSKS